MSVKNKLKKIADKLVIDKEFQTLIQPLDDIERKHLEDNLKQHGCRDPIDVWMHEGERIIVDGHHRYALCLAHGIDFKVRYLEFGSREAAEAWMIRNQLSRRSITREYRQILIGTMYQLLKGPHGGQIAGQNASQKTSENPTLVSAKNSDKIAPNAANTHEKGSCKTCNSLGENDPESDPENTSASGKVAKEVAERFGVAQRTVHNADAYTDAINRIAEIGGGDVRGLILNRTVASTQPDVIKLAALPDTKLAAACKKLFDVGSVAGAIEAVSGARGKSAPPAQFSGDIVDGRGHAISAKQREHWDRNRELDQLVKQLNSIAESVEAICATKAGCYLSRGRVLTELSSARAALKGARFYCQCPECKGKGCKHCHDTGLVTKAIIRQIEAAV